LIQSPSIIDAIISNPHRSAVAARRASETKKEFFEKERGAQQIADELRAQEKRRRPNFSKGPNLITPASPRRGSFPASDDRGADSETDDSWLALEYLEEIYAETVAEREMIADKIIGNSIGRHGYSSERISIINRIMKMGMKDRARMAMKGDREARNILIRDRTLIVQAVVNNPRITEQEIEKIAAMRAIPEEVLRQIANNRQWSRLYPVAHNLVRNPRTPIANVPRDTSRLQLRDLAALSKNRNVSDAVRRQALRLSQARTGK
jgi:hypothetical protein